MHEDYTMNAQIGSIDQNHCSCDDCIAEIATVAPLSRRRLAEIAKGAPASNYERKEIRHAERLTGVHMPDDCRGCPHADEGWNGRAVCCGGAV